jgi:hypothetical protein
LAEGFFEPTPTDIMIKPVLSRAQLVFIVITSAITASAIEAATELKLQPDKYPDALVVLTDGTTTWSPMEGFGPIAITGGTARRPGDYPVKLLSTQKTEAGETKLIYQVANAPEKTEFSITAAQDEHGITLIIEGVSGEFPGIYTGSLRADPQILGWTVPERHHEDYAQHCRFPNIFYHRQLGTWVQGRWDLDFGNASGADSYYVRDAKSIGGIDATFFPGLTIDNGEDASALTQYYLDKGMTYVPFLEGKNASPLKERFRLSMGKSLWETVPAVNQNPSPYREEMSKLMYVDIWGGLYSDRSDFTRWMQETVGKWVGGLTIIQNWQGGGFDSHLPLALSDELPPDVRRVGTPEQMKAWMEEMKSWGRAGWRTNYQAWRDTPMQTVKRSQKSDGTPMWRSQPHNVVPIIKQQEAHIQRLLGTTATFSDQITSGGEGLPYVEYSKENPNAGTIRGARNMLRVQAKLIKELVGGPLLSETINSQFLLGEYADSGDYGIFDGFNRMFTPEFKLRRLHGLCTYYGMGLGYRYFFAPPYTGKNRYRQNQGNSMYASPWGAGSDDYRAMTIAYGNGAYLDYLSAEGMHPDKAITEAMTVGLLQRYYVGVPVREIYYESEQAGEWVTLEQLLLDGKNPSPFLARIKVVYENGLTVVVNRKEGALAWKLPAFGDILLPKHSYAVYSEDGAVEGFSGIPAATGEASSRIDYTKDEKRKVLFINPRATGYKNLVTATIFEEGQKTYDLPVERRLRPQVKGAFDDKFTEAVRWVFPKDATVTHVIEGKDAFARIETKDMKSVRISRVLGALSEGRITIRYRTTIPSEQATTFASVAVLRFGESKGTVREVSGRKAFVLPNTNGEWKEESFTVELPKENTRHIVLRLAANDTEVKGVKPAIGHFDVDSISLIPAATK